MGLALPLRGLASPSSLSILAPITIIGSGGLVIPKLDIILLTSLAFALREADFQIGLELCPIAALS